MAAIELRPALAADAAVVAAIGSRSFRDAYAAHSEPDDMAAHLDKHFSASAVASELAAGASRYLLASVDDVPGGIAKYRQQACPHDRVPGASTAIELQQLYVLANLQGRGLGQHLVTALLGIAAGMRAGGVWLSAWEQADWAIGFYRRVGFRELGKLEFTLGKTVFTDLLMWQAVTAAPQRGD